MFKVLKAFCSLQQNEGPAWTHQGQVDPMIFWPVSASLRLIQFLISEF